MPKRSFWAPEVLQISSMDCGVAAVSCMLSGFGIDANYEKLRQLCQTSVDGTSIDALENLCGDLGLDVCQHILPVDLVPQAMEGRLPLIALEEITFGRIHFVVVWNRVGRRLQVMDPAGGRIWTTDTRLTTRLVRHTQPFSAEDWSEWFPASSFCEALQASADSLLSKATIERICAPVLQGADPRLVSALDGALRLVRQTAKASPTSRSWNDGLFERAFQAALRDELPIKLRTVRVVDDRVFVEGTVFLGVISPMSSDVATAPVRKAEVDVGTSSQSSLLLNVLRLLGPEARFFIGGVLAGLLVLAVASAIELLVYRAALDVPRLVSTPGTRLSASAGLVILLFILLGLEMCVALVANRLGRYLEIKLRMKTLWAVPRVDDDFIKSRPTTDLAYRAQALSMGALLIPSMATMARAVGDLVVTLTAIALLDFRYALIVTVGACFYLASWLWVRSRLQELDTRLQIHSSRLMGILLDGLRGIRPIRLHGFQDAFRDEQQREITQWSASARAQVAATSRLQSSYTALEVLILTAVFAVFLYRHGDPRQFVLLAFWSFRLPPVITSLIQFAQQYPLVRNAVDRLLEVTQYVPDVVDVESAADETSGVSIEFRNVSLVLGGHGVLDEINLTIPSGQHVAIVGASGSGKSTLVGLLLGFHTPTAGELFVDGMPLDRHSKQSIRAKTMWIDPAIQLWNETLGANLEYASRGYSRRPALEVLERSDMLGVLASLERGLDAPVGAEGAFVSGGEGQRIRIGRALFRAGTRLALLDEPFRGLDRTTRHQLLLSIRSSAIRATMLFVSHDVSHALSFERVLVVDQGRIVEDGSPQELSTQDSIFARLLKAEEELMKSAWSERRWRRIRVENGLVKEAKEGA